jgi:RNA-dependent RNA polymerase
MEVDVLAKRLIILFPLRVKKNANTTTEIRHFKILAELAQAKTIYRTAQQDGCEVFIFPFAIPPQYYWCDDEAQRNLPNTRAPGWRAIDMWRRATDISEDTALSFTFPVATDSTHLDPAFLEVGRWTALRVVLSKADHASKLAASHLLLAFEDRNINLQVRDDFCVSHSAVTMWDFLDHQHHVSSDGDALALLQPSKFPFVHLEFGVRYQLEVCVSRRLLNEHTVSLEFLQGLAALDPLDAKRRLEFLADQGDVMYDPKDLLNWAAASTYMPNTRIPHYCVLARKAAVTPTTILLSTPVVETSNRVLRYFNHIQDRFLRVQFVEETEFGRMAMSCRNKEDVWKKILRTLYQGIQIGDRHYQFLAFGSSQLRQCGAYFFCPTDHISCDDIRRWMGEVGHIRIVAKYAARLGQCFSTTREMRGLPIPDVRSIPDVERNGYCFTDGVGIISDFMAQMIMEELTLDVYAEPSAFQFRMGGCKGVLVVWPQATKGEVCIRQSQEKFKAEVKNLEIIKCAKYSSATLNRQTITILECLGVTKKAFLDILEEQIRLYEEAMGKNDVAIEMLTNCVDENQSTLILAELLQAGFKTDKVQEPFVANLLSLWRSWSLKLLKEKARIPVDKSAFVLGCVDETSTLRGHFIATEGSSDKDISKLPQIFLQVSDSKIYNKTHVVKGLCVVGRNPSLHPGDIRVVEAVDIPGLHHLKDVVVFPSTGDRPVPNMLSGGDLDGDDFFVIWEPTLLPEIWNHPAMNYTSPSPETLDREVNVDDLRDFFVKYMKNDVLPLIATAHLALADRLGPLSKICKSPPGVLAYHSLISFTDVLKPQVCIWLIFTRKLSTTQRPASLRSGMPPCTTRSSGRTLWRRRTLTFRPRPLETSITGSSSSRFNSNQIGRLLLIDASSTASSRTTQRSGTPEESSLSTMVPYVASSCTTTWRRNSNCIPPGPCQSPRSAASTNGRKTSAKSLTRSSRDSVMRASKLLVAMTRPRLTDSWQPCTKLRSRRSRLLSLSITADQRTRLV